MEFLPRQSLWQTDQLATLNKKLLNLLTGVDVINGELVAVLGPLGEIHRVNSICINFVLASEILSVGCVEIVCISSQRLSYKDTSAQTKLITRSIKEQRNLRILACRCTSKQRSPKSRASCRHLPEMEPSQSCHRGHQMGTRCRQQQSSEVADARLQRSE